MTKPRRYFELPTVHHDDSDGSNYRSPKTRDEAESDNAPRSEEAYYELVQAQADFSLAQK